MLYRVDPVGGRRRPVLPSSTVVLAAVSVVLGARATVAQSLWTGVNNNGVYGDALNWSPSGVPAASANVTFPSVNPGRDFVSLGAGASVDSAVFSGTNTYTLGTNAFTVATTTLGGTGLSITGSGTANFTGPLVLQQTTTVSATGGNLQAAALSLVGPATGTFTGTLSVGAGRSATFGSVVSTGTTTLRTSGAGTVAVTGTTAVGSLAAGATLTRLGGLAVINADIAVSPGSTLQSLAGANVGGVLLLQNNASVSASGSTFSLSGPLNVTNGATASLAAGAATEISINGPSSFRDNSTLVTAGAGTVTFASGAGFVSTTSTVIASAGLTRNSSPMFFQDLRLSGTAIYRADADLSVSARLTATAGTTATLRALNGSVTVSGGVVLDVGTDLSLDAVTPRSISVSATTGNGLSFAAASTLRTSGGGSVSFGGGSTAAASDARLVAGANLTTLVGNYALPQVAVAGVIGTASAAGSTLRFETGAYSSGGVTIGDRGTLALVGSTLTATSLTVTNGATAVLSVGAGSSATFNATALQTDATLRSAGAGTASFNGSTPGSAFGANTSGNFGAGLTRLVGAVALAQSRLEGPRVETVGSPSLGTVTVPASVITTVAASGGTTTLSGLNLGTFVTGASASFDVASGSSVILSGGYSFGSGSFLRTSGPGTFSLTGSLISMDASSSIVASAASTVLSTSASLPSVNVVDGTVTYNASPALFPGIALTVNRGRAIANVNISAYDTVTLSGTAGATGRLSATGNNGYTVQALRAGQGPGRVEAPLSTPSVFAAGSAPLPGAYSIDFDGPLTRPGTTTYTGVINAAYRFGTGTLVGTLTDLAVVGTGHSAVFTLDTGTPVRAGGTIRALGSLGIVRGSGAPLINATLDVVSNAYLGGGPLPSLVSAVVRNGGTLSLAPEGGAVAQLSVEPGGTFSVTSGVGVTNQFGDITNAGAMTVAANGALAVGELSQILNTGTLENRGTINAIIRGSGVYVPRGDNLLIGNLFITRPAGISFPTSGTVSPLRVGAMSLPQLGRLVFETDYTLGADQAYDVVRFEIAPTRTVAITGASLTAQTIQNYGTLRVNSTSTFTGRIDNDGLLEINARTMVASVTNSPSGRIVVDGTTFERLTPVPPYPVSSLVSSGVVELRRNATLGFSSVRLEYGGSLIGNGTVNGAFSTYAGSEVRPNGGNLTFASGYLSLGPGSILRVSPDASVVGSVLNDGLIYGAGLLQSINSFAGSRIEPSGLLNVIGILTLNANSGATITTGSKLVISGFMTAFDGKLTLAGGSFERLAGDITVGSSGSITGYGQFASSGLRNQGTINLAGGTTLIDAPVTNDPGRLFRIQAGTAIFNAPVVNNGNLVVGTGGYAVYTSTLNGAPAGGPGGGGPTSGWPTSNALAGTGVTSLSPGAYLEADGLSQASLTLAGTASNPATLRLVSREPAGLILPSGRTVAPSLSVVNSLTVTRAAGFATGLVDLTTNDLLLRTSSPAAGVASLQQLARDFLVTGGTVGLGTSSPEPFHRLAIFPNDPFLLGGSPASAGQGFYESFDGVPLVPTDVLVRLTYIGDTNIDGRLDATDLVNVIEGFSTGASGWWNGDFDYDGVVTAADFAAFQSARAAFAAGQLPDLGLPSAWSGSSGAIPEPGAIGLLAIPLLAATRRRR